MGTVAESTSTVQMPPTRFADAGAPGVIGGKFTVSCNHFIISSFRITLWILKPQYPFAD